jgi:hypothetical protein
MKLFIELSEKDVQVRVDELLGERIASITDAFLNEKVSEIVDKKLVRYLNSEAMAKQSKALLIEAFGEPGQFGSEYMNILRAEAYKLLQDQHKYNGG